MSVGSSTNVSLISECTSERATSTSPSSVASDLPKGDIQLPSPFHPPSLAASQFADVDTRPREIDTALPPVPRDEACKNVDSQDVGTPDSWVIRDHRMVRLTGKHPFNAEAKLNDLFAQGFLTPSNLFFVRNHGAVPKVDIELAREWSLTIHG
ncbi:hypothetical protein C0991_008708 [Blastosporella zonata]|nr:hypothetical protein C0991_008708 [Blastosporella zonata]